MFDSSFTMTSKEEPDLVDKQFLSILTSLFIDGMAGECSKKRTKTGAFSHGNHNGNSVARIPLKFRSVVLGTEIKTYCTRKAESRNVDRSSASDPEIQNLRTLIFGLSDVFNNLLMGIWGNISLIKIDVDPLEPFVAHLEKMESFIQNGSALMNGIFGYLSERRMTTKKIRLNLLVRELIEYIPLDCFPVEIDVWTVQRVCVVGQKHAVAIAETLSFMLEQIVMQTQIQYEKILQYVNKIENARKRLQAIKQLIDRAWEIICRLRLFAGQDVKI